MKHIFRIVKHICLSVALIPLQAVGAVALAIRLPCIDKNTVKLPWYMRWFDNADNDGLAGDRGYQEANSRLGYDPNGWYAKWWWLSVRNPLNYFKVKVLGIAVQDIVQRTIEYEVAMTHGKFVGDWYSGGFRCIELKMQDGSEKYEYYFIWPYQIKTKWLCFRARIGWAIGNSQENDVAAKNRTYFRWTCSINPFKSFRGTPPASQQQALCWQKIKTFFKCGVPTVKQTLENQSETIAPISSVMLARYQTPIVDRKEKTVEAGDGTKNTQRSISVARLSL